MGEFDALQAEIYREKVRRSRAMTPEERLRDCFELGDEVIKRMMTGLHLRCQDLDPADEMEALRAQLARLRKLHERNLYLPYPDRPAG